MGTEGEFQEDRREWIGREGKWEGDSVGRLTEKKREVFKKGERLDRGRGEEERKSIGRNVSKERDGTGEALWN